jgi:LPS export ABC transporter protein LptC
MKSGSASAKFTNNPPKRFPLGDMQPKNNDHSLFRNITLFFPALLIILSLFSCFGENKQLGEAINNRDSLPVMRTLGVTTFVSDSGVTRYHIDAEEWLIYDKKRPSYWAFEKGVYLESFDSLFHVEANIKADTAYYFDKEHLWKLMGGVKINSIKGDKLETELLYWNESTRRIYSDRFTRFEDPDKIMFGYGFESDQQLINPRIHNIEGVLYFDEDATQTDNDSIK